MNSAPEVSGLDGDSVVFVEGGTALRLDAGGNGLVTDADPLGYTVRRVGSGFTNSPLFAAPVPDGTGRMFIVEKLGTIFILDPDTGAKQLFLDVSGQISTTGERGLLGLAAAPDYAASGTFYVYLTLPDGTNEIRRYATMAGDPDVADPGSADTVLRIPHPGTTTHNGGWIGFGPDGLLYISSGDGATGGAPAQDPNSLLGKMLRIDVSADAFPADPLRDYAVPTGNPFAGGGGAGEVWALGLRNPYRAGFDLETGNLLIGDVGQNSIEEIDLMRPTDGGANFGWPAQEGTQDFSGPDSPAYTDPVIEYPNDTGPLAGQSVIGGFIYRGSISGLQDKYVFGDLDGDIWAVPSASLSLGSTVDNSQFQRLRNAFTPDQGDISLITSFALDEAGDLYVVDYLGEVFKVEASATPNFAGGGLTIAITAGGLASEDVLAISTASTGVSLSNGMNPNSFVFVDGVVMGRIASGGHGMAGAPLIVDFTSGATPARISTLVRAVTYLNTNTAEPSTATRTLSATLSDGGGILGGGGETTTWTMSVAVVQNGVHLEGDGGDNVLRGTTGFDELFGLTGNDQLIGLGAVDVTDGGPGDDWHFVDNPGDRVIERVGEGRDIVYASVTYALPADQDVEVLSTATQAGTAAIDLTGNALANVIVGNAGVNVLAGRNGADTLVGLAGNDQLSGENGIDTTDGGTGDDWHFVDALGDRVVERPGEGRDIVYALANYILAAGSEAEVLSAASQAGTTALSLTGNEFDNAVVGNAGANVLNGAAGVDFLVGLGGNDQLIGGTAADVTDGGPGDDWHFVDNAADRAVERVGEGRDIVYASVDYTLGAGVSVELLSAATQAATSALNLTGNEIANVIVGNDGANVIDGKLGADFLKGLAGADTFAFTTALGGDNIDVIEGFTPGSDSIRLDDAVFAGLAPGVLAANAFVIGSAAADATDRIVYDSQTGALLFDSDGVGGSDAIQFARLSTGLTNLAASDFVVA